MLVMGAASCYTAIILIRCFGLIEEILAGQDASDPKVRALAPAVTYGDIGEAAFGRAGQVTVQVLMHTSLVLVGVVYNLLGGLNLVNIFGSRAEWLTPEVGIAIMAGAVWFHVFLKSMGEVAAVSAVNTVVTVTLAVTIVVESLLHPPAEPPRTTWVSPDPMRLGSGFAAFILAFDVHAVLPTIYGAMRTKEHYEPMVKGTYVAVLAVTLPMLVVGYAVYGEAVQSPVYNTPALARSSLLKVMVGLITAHLLGAYAIVLNPTERALETTLGIDNLRLPLLWRMCLRTMFVLFTYGVAVVFQNSFPPLLDLVSALTAAPTMFLCPCMFYITLSAKAGRPLSHVQLAGNALIMGVSLVGAVFGIVGAIQSMIATW